MGLKGMNLFRDKVQAVYGQAITTRIVMLVSVLLVLLQSSTLQHFLLGWVESPLAFQFVLYSLVVFVSLLWGGDVLAQGRIPVPLSLGVFAVLCIFSLFWASEVQAHLSSLILFTYSMVAASWCARRASPSQMLICILVAATLISLLLTFNAFSLGASFSLLQDGLFQHKNHMGRFAVLLIFASIAYAVDSKKAIILLLAFFYVWVLSRASSAGAIMASLFTGWFLIGGGIYLYRKPFLLAYALVSLLFLVVGGFYSGEVLELLGRSPTLTGRIDIWRQLIPHIQEAPIWGHGFDQFKEYIKGVSGLGHSVSDAHNGYLEIAGVLGCIGLLVFLWSIIQFGLGVKNLAGFDVVVLLFFVTIFLFQNTYESLIFKKLDLYWFLFCYALCRVKVSQECSHER